ncbi:MAG: 50S ribosomal protein L21 [Anaerosomatales bacterium]|nr:50S ribosomal protein L21 [Anaerosomatales bacterium]
MYAVVASGGKQEKVEQSAIVVVEKIDAEVGDTVELPVVLIADGETILAGADALAGASVTARVVEHFKGDKQMVFKFKRRKGYKRTKGHRQWQTALEIEEISVKGGAKKPAAKAEKPAKAAEKPEAKAEKPEAVAAATEPGQCEALKADGSQCQNKAKEGSKYCGVHAKKYEG